MKYRRTTLATVACAAVLLTTACGSPEPAPADPPPVPPSPTWGPISGPPIPPSPTSTPPPAPVTPPNPASADGADPGSVARVVLQLMWQIDTTRDRSFADGLTRAAMLLTPAYADAVKQTPPAQPDAQWREWQQHQAYTTVSTEPSPEDTPPDSTKTAHRAFVLTYTPTGRDGWTAPPIQQIALVTLQRMTGGWAVEKIEYA